MQAMDGERGVPAGESLDANEAAGYKPLRDDRCIAADSKDGLQASPK